VSDRAGPAPKGGTRVAPALRPSGRAGRALYWTVFGVALGLAALFLSWRGLAAVDFAYPVFYDHLAIDATIEREGPRNSLRPGFHRTDRGERERLFGAIVTAVRDHGRGLEDLVYHTPDGRALGTLLTPAEIQHLEDVAVLVAGFEAAGWAALALAALLAIGAARARLAMPGLAPLGLGAGALVAIGTGVVFAIGPVTVFYWLHEQIFPPDHRWFFHYDESLMAMMMQAPNLFGAIALLWLVLAVGLLVAMWLATARALKPRSPRGGRQAPAAETTRLTRSR
jgi:hypothetical protein